MDSLTTQKRAKKRARLAARPATNKGETLSALRLPGHTQHAPDPGTRHPPWSQAGVGRSAGRPTFDLIWDVALSRSLKQGCLCVV